MKSGNQNQTKLHRNTTMKALYRVVLYKRFSGPVTGLASSTRQFKISLKNFSVYDAKSPSTHGNAVLCSGQW